MGVFVIYTPNLKIGAFCIFCAKNEKLVQFEKSGAILENWCNHVNEKEVEGSISNPTSEGTLSRRTGDCVACNQMKDIPVNRGCLSLSASVFLLQSRLAGPKCTNIILCCFEPIMAKISLCTNFTRIIHIYTDSSILHGYSQKCPFCHFYTDNQKLVQ